jgi:uncharacterized lipoprotein YmbA
MKRPNKSGAHAEIFGNHYRQAMPLGTAYDAPGGRAARFAGRSEPYCAALLMTFLVCACLSGCSFFKPAPDTSRHFVLSASPASETAGVTPGVAGVDVVHVKIPTYLFNSSLAVRKGANEIVYPPADLWAERLDAGIPRVLTADLSSLLPSDPIRSSVGAGEDVAKEISVSIEQFDVNISGQAVLIAKWRVFSASGEKILRSGESRLSRSGPAPGTDPAGAVSTLSALMADLSHELAQALRAT